MRRDTLKWISVGACLTSAVLWAASTFFRVQWTYGNGQGSVIVGSGAVYWMDWACELPVTGLSWGRPQQIRMRWWPIIAGRVPLAIPLWMPFCTALVASWLLSRRAHPRPKVGTCANCRYDLTGNITGVCPECGAPIPEDLRRNEST